MSKLSSHLKYEAKAKELRKLVDIEALKLQKAVEAKDSALLEVNSLKEKKTLLSNTINNLEIKIKEKQDNLNQLMERENGFLHSTKMELDKEKEALSEVKEKLEEYRKKIEELSKISVELNGFVKKTENIRVLYQKQQEDLNFIEKRHKELEERAEILKKYMISANKELDDYKKYLSDLYGKLASYVTTAKDTILQINEMLEEKKIPIVFDLPPGEVIKINFDNFNIKRIDT